jgi:signal transduction histidine kinase
MGKNDDAIAEYQKLLDDPAVKSFSSYRLDLLERLAVTYEKKGAYEQALKYTKENARLSDSLNYEAQNIKVEQLREQLETEQKEKEIQLLSKNKILQENELKLQRTLLLVAALIILIILITIAFLSNRNTLKQRNKELELRNRIAADLHDDVGSSLSSIRLLSEMVRSSENVPSAIIEKISQNIRETMESMSDIVWMVKPEKDGSSLDDRIQKYIYELSSSSNIAFEFTATNMGQVNFSMLHKRNIYFICKEAVNNALKYAHPNNISVDMNYLGGAFLMIIKDDGKGFDRQKIKPGNGIENMENRARDIGASLDLTSSDREGCKVVLRLVI